MRSKYLWLLVGIGIMVVLGGGWWVLRAQSATTVPWAVEMRKQFYLKMGPKVGMRLDNLPEGIATMQVVQTAEGKEYLYTMLGEYQEIDLEREIFWLKLANGMTYGFFYGQEGMGRGLVYIDIVQKGEFEEKEFEREPWIVGDLIMAQWTDRRGLSVVLKEAAGNQDRLVDPYLTADDFVRIGRN